MAVIHRRSHVDETEGARIGRAWPGFTNSYHVGIRVHYNHTRDFYIIKSEVDAARRKGDAHDPADAVVSARRVANFKWISDWAGYGVRIARGHTIGEGAASYYAVPVAIRRWIGRFLLAAVYADDPVERKLDVNRRAHLSLRPLWCC